VTPIVLLVVGLAMGVLLEPLMLWLAAPEERQDTSEELTTPETPSPPAADLASESGALTLLLSSDAARLSWRVAIIAVTAGTFATAGARYDDPSHLALVTAYIAVLILCGATDILAYRVPNVVTYPAILLALGAGILMPDADFVRVLGGGALAGGIMLLPIIITRGKGLGMGDLKLAAFIGLALGLSLTLSALLLMALAGGVAAAALLITGLRHRGDPIPYAPFISIGALAVMLWQGVAFHSLM
jgi:prepilin signal peptidase PulO-like enzyme (type II secretory pathway)